MTNMKHLRNLLSCLVHKDISDTDYKLGDDTFSTLIWKLILL